MEVLRTIAAFRAARDALPGAGELGLVPTMGFLHEGHLSLVRQARAECGRVAVSIFVNPAQFAPGGDFDRYPRDLRRDLDLLEGAGVDLVFTPDAEEIYPAGFDSEVHVGGVSQGLEGAARPGHFTGVATVVCKLFNIVRPTRAYFGQKDAQQVVVVKKLVLDLNLPLEVRVGETVRDADGLAMSSRNSYLSPGERAAAAQIPRALEAALRAAAGGDLTAARLREVVSGVLSEAEGLQPLYIALSDPETLQDLEEVGSNGALLSLAVRVGSARLIDNVRIAAFGRPARNQPFSLSPAQISSAKP